MATKIINLSDGTDNLRPISLYCKDYSVTLEANSNIPSPYGYYAELSLTSDVSTYGQIVSATVSGKSTNPALCKVYPSLVRVYGIMSNDLDVTVRVWFQKV